MKNRKRRIIQYLLFIAAILAASALMPYVINAVTDMVKSRILNTDQSGDMLETELKETEGVSVLEPVKGNIFSEETFTIGTVETETEDVENIKPGPAIGRDRELPETEDAAQLQAQKEAEAVRSEMLKMLAYYKDSFHPVYREAETGIIDQFVGENTEKFNEAAAEYAFGYYGSEYAVTQIRFDFITEDDLNTITCLLEISTAEDPETEAPDLVLCSYNKEQKQYIFQ